MPTYIIEQYELHTVKYKVTANSLGDAINQVFDGDGEFMDNSDEVLQPDTSRGLTLSGMLAEDVKSLKEYEIIDDDSVMLQSIASVTIVD